MKRQEPSDVGGPTVQVSTGETCPAGCLTVSTGGLSLPALERAVIAFALELHGGNRTRAARFLRVSRSALLYRMRKYRLTGPSTGSATHALKDVSS